MYLLLSNVFFYLMKKFTNRPLFVSYCRWVCFCHVPVFCESFQKFDTTLIFGRQFLSSVFHVMRQQLMERFTAEQEKMLPEKRTLVIKHFPKYVQQI